MVGLVWGGGALWPGRFAVIDAIMDSALYQKMLKQEVQVVEINQEVKQMLFATQGKAADLK